MLVVDGHLSLVAAPSDGRRRHGARHACAPRLLARHACRHRRFRRHLDLLPRRHRHALVGLLGRERQCLADSQRIRLSGRALGQCSELDEGPRIMSSNSRAGFVENAPVPHSEAQRAMSWRRRSAWIKRSKSRRAGMAPGFEIAIPGDDTGVFTASLFPDDLSNERMIHIDQYLRQAAGRSLLRSISGCAAG